MEVSAGSVRVWLGGTFHGVGAITVAGARRYGVILSFSLRRLHQEKHR